MEVNGTNSTYPWSPTPEKSSIAGAGEKILGKDDFLKLLITELKYQDPLEPMEDKEFISQMASFSSLEQMNNLNTSFEKLSETITTNLIPGLMLQQSSNMIGKTVDYVDPDTMTMVSGTVESVMVKQGIPYYVIDGKEVAMSSITRISNREEQVMDEILNQLAILAGEAEGAKTDD
ncbi:MAG: flagellar hook assembly protein FlgD [Syntrophomonadaceae bacterium]